MRNDASLHGHSTKSGRGGSFFPSSLRVISSYLRNVSSSNSIAATVHSAKASVTSTTFVAGEERQREQVQWASFDILELGPSNICHVLLLTYLSGFQVWDVEEADDVRELVSKRDGPVGFLRIQPRPGTLELSNGCSNLAWPLLLIVTEDITKCGASSSPGGGSNGHMPLAGGNNFVPTVVRFYSMQSHTYVQDLRFRTAIVAVRCSPRVVAVALSAQIYCFDAATLQSTFSVLTYPSPQAGAGGLNAAYGAMAVGSRWLAYAANQSLVSNTGRISPQSLTPSPGVSPSTSPANGGLLAHYAKESGKHIATGIVTLGGMGYRTLSKYYSELLPDGANSPGSGIPNQKSTNNGLNSHEAEHAGIVIVRDFVSKMVIAQFRAHAHPLSALCFDPSGTLLVTASVNGHNLNVFRLTPPATGSDVNSKSFDASTTYVHLYKLCRGITNAIIRDISFSTDSHWIAISSSRGTSHLFAISPFGGIVGPGTHGVNLEDRVHESMVASPWWFSTGLEKSNQQPFLLAPPVVSLSVVSRIKNGSSGWHGTVVGAVATAAGKSCSSGAVAVIFHDGRGKNRGSEVGHISLKDQLWVLSPPGHLIRYSLRPSVGIDGAFYNDDFAVMGGMSANQRHDLQLVVEPLQKWDVCRRPNWVEREEKVEVLGVSGAVLREAKLSGTPTCRNNTTAAGEFENGGVGKVHKTVEELHRWFLSNAEVQMHHVKTPIWAKPQMFFHIFLGASSQRPSRECEFGGEIEIEKIQTRVVEVRRKDLVPVFKRLKNAEGVLSMRELAMESLPISGAKCVPLLHDGSLKDGFIGIKGGHVQIQHSRNARSRGSEGGVFGVLTPVQNGFCHSYQGSRDLCTPRIPSYCTLTPIGHQVHERPMGFVKSAPQFGQMPNVGLQTLKQTRQQVSTCIAIESQSMDSSRQGQHNAYDKTFSLKDKAGDGHFTSLECVQNSSSVLPNAKGKAPALQANSVAVTPFACAGQFDTSCTWHSSLSKGGVVDKQNSSECSDLNQWEASLAEGNSLPLESSNQESKEGAVVINPEGNCPQDYDAITEDVESIGANSKSEDYEKREQGDDVWEGAMFPFMEDS